MPAREADSPLRLSPTYHAASADTSATPTRTARAIGGTFGGRVRDGTSAEVRARSSSTFLRHDIEAGSTTQGPTAVNEPIERSGAPAGTSGAAGGASVISTRG